MPSQELVQRINYLARKERYEGLTPAEKEEQQKLRRQYLDDIRNQIVTSLEGAGYKKKEETPDKQKECTHCGCRHHHHHH